MAQTRFFTLLAGGLLLASCTNLPVRWVKVKAVRQGPTHIYWTYLSSVEDMTPEQRNRHLRAFEEPKRLPISLEAEPGEFLWVVPVCGWPLWNKADAIQVPLDASPIEVTC